MIDNPFGAGHVFYHGSAEPLSDVVLPGDESFWWRPMDHELYMSPPRMGGDDADFSIDDDAELAAELRTAYANQVYEAFRVSENPDLRAMASEYGLSGLGAQVGILFVTANREYVERYGVVHEIDMEADGILDILYDENASRESWLIVMRAGVPFPLKYQPSAIPPGPRP